MSQVCTAKQFGEPIYDRLCGEIAQEKLFHRKQWEYIYILRALDHIMTVKKANLDLDDPIVAIDIDGMAFSIRIHAGVDRYISADIRRDGVWEPFETRVFRALCRRGDSIVDVGANIGWYSLVASFCVGETGHVIALEPEPRNFDLLVDNLKRNAVCNVSPWFVAAGGRPGHRPLYLSTENMGDHRLFEGDEERRAQMVEVRTLSQMIAVSGRKPNVVKSDTQGSEWEVVQGLSTASFDASTCCWLIEFWPHGLAGMGAGPAPLLAWFEDHGYAFFELSEANPRLVPTNREALLNRASTDLAKETGHFINLLLMHPSDSRMRSLDSFLH